MKLDAFFSPLLLIVLGSLPITSFAESHGSYRVFVPGFGFRARHGVIVDQGHFDEVAEFRGCPHLGPGHVFRGGRPDFSEPNALATLKENNVSLVVDLRVESARSRKVEEDILIENNIGYFNVGLTTELPLPNRTRVYRHHPGEASSQSLPSTLTAVERTIRVIRAELEQGGNVFIHCAHGEDRTGLIVALLRDCRSWRGEFNAYGGTMYSGLQQIFDEYKLHKSRNK